MAIKVLKSGSFPYRSGPRASRLLSLGIPLSAAWTGQALCRRNLLVGNA